MFYTKCIIEHLIFFSLRGKKGTSNELLRKEIQFKWILNRRDKNRCVPTKCWWRLISSNCISGRALPYSAGLSCISCAMLEEGVVDLARLHMDIFQTIAVKGHAKCHWKDDVLQVVNKVCDMIYYPETSVNWMATAFEWIVFLLS